MEAPVQVLGLSKDEAEARSVDRLDMVGFANKKGHHPSRLSGGQQRRVATARALAMRPKVMLLDEVTAALDPEMVGEVLNVDRDVSLTFYSCRRHLNRRTAFKENGSAALAEWRKLAAQRTPARAPLETGTH